MEISLDELFNTYTSQEQIKESFEKRTVPTGRYTFFASKAEARVQPENGPQPGRKSGSFFGKLTNGDDKRVGSVGFDASWEVVKLTDKNGRTRPDSQSMLWGQLVTALNMKESSVADVITAAGKYPLNVYVTEVYKDTATNKWTTIKDAEQRSAARSAGFDLRNFVNGISRVA
jgi:hypothetical protein